jgi:hypothetical protein
LRGVRAAKRNQHRERCNGQKRRRLANTPSLGRRSSSLPRGPLAGAVAVTEARPPRPTLAVPAAISFRHPVTSPAGLLGLCGSSQSEQPANPVNGPGNGLGHPVNATGGDDQGRDEDEREADPDNDCRATESSIR